MSSISVARDIVTNYKKEDIIKAYIIIKQNDILQDIQKKYERGG